jgi:carbonic anhydrase/acetyltransferase-like protein (isoleucine patch superfamily)
LRLKALHAWDKLCLRRLQRRYPGLEIHPTASRNLAVALFELGDGARLRIGAGVDTDRLPGRLCLRVEDGASMEIGDGTWLRTTVDKIRLVAFPGAHLSLGPHSWLNGCQLYATERVEAGEGAMIGPGSRISDSGQHPLDVESAVSTEPVRIGEFVWIASDVTVLAGVSIGGHSVIGARALVAGDIPPHTLAYGVPARPRGSVGKRRAFM